MYRNDHDAALWRIDALEAEVRRLEGELARREVPPMPLAAESEEPIDPEPSTSFWRWLATFLIVGALFACITADSLAHRHHYSYKPRPVPQLSVDGIDRAIRRAAPSVVPASSNAVEGRFTCTGATTTQLSPAFTPSKTTSSRLAPSGIAW